MEPWWIVERLEGYVDSLEPGQGGWTPIFRSRRLNDGGKFKVHTQSRARLNLADGTSYIFYTGSRSEMVINVIDYPLSGDGRQHVFDLRKARVIDDVMRALGRQERFNPGRGNGGSLGARG